MLRFPRIRIIRAVSWAEKRLDEKFVVLSCWGDEPTTYNRSRFVKLSVYRSIFGLGLWNAHSNLSVCLSARPFVDLESLREFVRYLYCLF